MVGNNPKEEVLTSCKATAMIYNDTQKKWVHCAPNGPAKIQLLFSLDTQAYRIVGRQIQDHEVVLNHSITKGIKYNQATPTFHQWRDQSCVYGLNFSTKLDAQEFGTTMMKILESVNGSANTSQTNANGGATPPSSTLSNNNNTNNSATLYKRQTNQPPSSLPPTATTVSINSTSTTSSSLVSEPQQQQQQQHSSSSYNNQLRPNSNSINSTSISTNNNHYSQQQQSTEEDETNYALISDSYSSYGDNSANKNNNIPQAPPFNPSMSTTGNAPPAAPPPPPPPPPPPLPNGFGSGPPPAPALVIPSANGNSAANTGRKSSTAVPQMDLMSEMAAKFAQRRKHVDENEKPDSNPANTAKGSAKPPTTSTLPAATAAPVQTSPRVARKTAESQPTPHYTSNDLEKLKADILSEIRKDIEKAKQEIITAILDHQKQIKK